MKIQFRLLWVVSGTPGARSFKQTGAWDLFSDYSGRIAKFCPVEFSGAKIGKEASGRRVWVCDRGAGAKVLSSEDVARRLSAAMDAGVRQLDVVIGGPDGFTAEALSELRPDLRWSFGPLTLPHELAAAVAAEQIYRSWTILRRLPYHSGH